MKKYFIVIFIIYTNNCFSLKQTPNYIHCEDISIFWSAYDSVLSTTDKAKQLKILKNFYFKNVDSYYRAFISKNNLSADDLLSKILNHPNYWRSIRYKTEHLEVYFSTIDHYLKKFKELYPSYKQVPIYFAISGLQFGGEALDSAVVMGTELAIIDSTINVSELKTSIKANASRGKDRLLQILIHEMVHVQQSKMGNIKLLSYCIAEGSCDFIAEKVLDGKYQTNYISYGKKNEPQLYSRFLRDLNRNDISNWIHNAKSSHGEPSDLGYFIGYAICNSYYSNQKNKKKAMKDIIELNYLDENAVRGFYYRSKYFEKFTN